MMRRASARAQGLDGVGRAVRLDASDLDAAHAEGARELFGSGLDAHVERRFSGPRVRRRGRLAGDEDARNNVAKINANVMAFRRLEPLTAVGVADLARIGHRSRISSCSSYK